MKIGVLGTGFGIVHIQALSKNPLVDELVFFSRSEGKVKTISAQFGMKGTTDMNEILSDPTVDVVTIALPNELHTATAIRAMEFGKNVICEIPVCLNLEDAQRMLAVSKKTGKQIFVNLFSRFSSAHRFVHENISNGEYGQILTIQAVNRSAPVWGPMKLGLDVVPLNSCICDFDWLYWCLGDLSFNGIQAVEVAKSAACIDMLLSASNGARVQLTNSTLMPLPYGVKERLEISFENAAMTYEETSWCDQGNSAEFTVYDNAGKRIIQLPECDEYYDSLSYSLERIKDGHPGITDFQQAIPALKIALELKSKL